MSLYRSFGLLPAALGLLGTGFLAENVGLTTTFVVAGAVIVAVGAAGFFIPSVMRLDGKPCSARRNRPSTSKKDEARMDIIPFAPRKQV